MARSPTTEARRLLRHVGTGLGDLAILNRGCAGDADGPDNLAIRDERNAAPWRWRPGCAGFGGGADRHRLRRPHHLGTAGECRHDQGACCHCQHTPAGRARYSDCRRGRAARPLRFNLECAVRTEGNAKEHCGQTQCRGSDSLGRSISADPAGQSRARGSTARAADAGGSWRAAQGRNREVVADHQGGEHQGGMKRRVAGISERDAMKLPRRNFLHLAAGAAALPAVSRIARAQAYPTRPVRIIVGFPGGSASDTTARLIGQSLSERLGQPFVVENRPGAASNIAAEAVVRAPPDGYTLLLVTSVNAINAKLYESSLSFDLIHDIVTVAWAWCDGSEPDVPGHNRSRLHRLRQRQSRQDQHGNSR